MTDREREAAELRDAPMSELADLYERLWGRPPRVKHRAFLTKRILWKREEARVGGLSVKAKQRLEELIAEIDIDLGPQKVTGKVARTKGAKLPPPGSTLVRPWKGEDIVVRILDDGFECDGKVFRSLSAIAKSVTGSHMSGPAFFGLTERRKSG